MLTDLRYALRQIARSPAFTIVAVLTLAIGIGANTALFSLGNGILARPLPEITGADRLVWLTPIEMRAGRALMLSHPDVVDYRNATDVFTSAAAMGDGQFSIATGGDPLRVRGQWVSGSYFDVLGVRFQVGRGFLPDEDVLGSAHPVIVISYRLWQERFAGNPAIVGRRVTVNGSPFTVIGVAPERFNGADHAERRDVWAPISLVGATPVDRRRLLTERGTWWLRGVARLRPDVSLAKANVAVATIAARIAAIDSADHRGMSARVYPVESGMTPNDMNDVYPVAALAGAVTLLVLLIACANVSNLLLGRAVARRREIAVRLSLGAARSRIVRQLLTESVVLAALGTVLGFLVALWATDIMAAIIPAPIDVTPDRRVLAFTMVAALITGLGFGVLPALHATRTDVIIALKDATVGFDRRRSRLQGAFVIAQVSLSLVLLVTAGMFLSALYKANRMDVHFDATSNVLAASFDLSLQGYSPERADAFLEQLRERAAALPGVDVVSFTNQVPMSERNIGADITLENERATGSRRFGEGAGMEVYHNTIRPDYFRTVGIPLAHGRDFRMEDALGSPGVAIVSEDFARRAWPDDNPLGKRVSVRGPDGPYLTVVGVAREALTMGVNERKRPIIYTAQRQNPRVLDLTVLVRSHGDARPLAAPLRSMVRSLDPALPVYGVQTLAQYRYDRGSESRLGSTLLAIFGSLALLLATIGVYAVLAFSVGQRTREIGVRVALGAVRREIIELFVREGLRLAAVGLAIGFVLSAGVAKVLSSLFLGLAMSDALSFAGAAVLLVGASLAASWIPARRAARIDPMVALRNE
jgi:predicted permease